MIKRCLFVLVAFVAASAAAAHADTLNYRITFTSDTGYGTAGATYLLSFDPTLTYTNATTGLQVISTSGGSYHDTPSSNSGFNYDPNTENGLLTFGSLDDNSVADLDADPDYRISIGNFGSAAPVFHDYFYNDGLIAPESSASGTVTEIATTPEPSTLMLLGTGVLGAVGTLRRRLVA